MTTSPSGYDLYVSTLNLSANVNKRLCFAPIYAPPASHLVSLPFFNFTVSFQTRPIRLRPSAMQIFLIISISSYTY